MEILTTQNLTKRFDGVIALDHLSLSIQKGKISSLIGPNGSGKTTFFNVVSGFLSPDHGKVQFKNRDLTRLSSHQISRLGVGRLWQDIRVFKKLTVLENVLISQLHQPGENPLVSIFLRRKSSSIEQENLRKANQWLALVELEANAHKYAEDLSYGEQKLLGLARLLAADAELLLLDEPVSSVDKQMINKMQSLLRKLIEQDKTIIVVEHNLGFVSEISDFIVLLNNGRAVAQGTAAEIMNNPVLKEVYLGI